MAVCTADILTADARCLVEGMSDRQLLAAILCVLATQNSMACDPATLVAASRCLVQAMNDRQLLASIALTLCEGGGGGGGGTDYNLEFAFLTDLPATPADPTKVWTAYFNDGNPTMHWSVIQQAWV